MKKFILYLLLITAIHQTLPAQERARWRQVFPKNVPPARKWFGMAKLTEGKVLMFGGYNKTDKFLNDTWIFDYKKMEWSQIFTNHNPEPIANHKLSQIKDGNILLYGGANDNYIFNNTWNFDINLMDWVNLKPICYCDFTDNIAMCKLVDGRVIRMNIDNLNPSYTNSYVFDLNKNEWTKLNLLESPNIRLYFNLAYLSDNNIMLYGGWDGNPMKDTRLFNTSFNKWKSIPDSNQKSRAAHSLSDISNNKVIAFGGLIPGNDSINNNNQTSNDCWLFDFTDTTWMELIINIKPEERNYHSTSNIMNNKILLFGGMDVKNNYFNDTWIFDYDSTAIDDVNDYNINTIQKSTYLYPNPANEYINITNDNNIKSYSIFNIIGELEETKEVNSNSININTNTLPTGIYSIKLIYDSTSEIKKIIINR